LRDPAARGLRAARPRLGLRQSAGTVDVRREQTADRPPVDASVSLQVPADALSARRARAFVGEFCTTAGLAGEVRRTASLLVSELVTNAIVHARTTATIQIQFGVSRTLRVAVSDDSPARPSVDLHPGARAEGGRGMLIVSTLAARWGVETAPAGGKSVWFELDA
jgi:anti-sigma regulatory factor (Ser/Thr protein kinase)